ncbi:MAG: hypothetical protein ACFFKA_02040, partial [Candidatus Thorarchaeota archaeon]
MDEEEIPNENIINWTFCPICGTKIPKLENIKFCIKCGVDLQYIKTHRILPQNRQGTTEYKTLQDESLKYFPIKPKLNDDDLIDLKDKTTFRNARLKVAGGKTHDDNLFIRKQMEKLKKCGYYNDIE